MAERFGLGGSSRVVWTEILCLRLAIEKALALVHPPLPLPLLPHTPQTNLMNPPTQFHPFASHTGIMGMSFGNYALCDAEFSCFPPLFDDVVSQLGLANKYACVSGASGGIGRGRGKGSINRIMSNGTPPLP